jgi:hypothetical protein
MKVIMTRYSISGMLEETGDDINFIHIFFKIDDKPEYKMPYIVPYQDLLHFILETDKATGHYLDKIRSVIHGYGPKHSKVFKIMEDEGFNLEPFIIQYLESKDEVFFQQFDEWCSRLQFSSNQKEVKDSFEKLKSKVTPEYCLNNINKDAFKDALDQAIHETTLKYFPGLFEKGDKHIAAYKSKLMDTTFSFYSEIDKIMHDKFNPYWEEKYNASQQQK